jgi:DNA gyrase subunit A
MELNTVDFVPNFDGNEVEPVILPSRFPMLLLNGASGIAVGMATNIPPHNFGELASAIEVMVNKRINSDSNCSSNSSENEITTEELYAIVPAPDFPTGGLIMGQEKAKQLYDTGRGSILLRAKASIETLKLKSSNGKILQKEAIIVTEVPYLCNKATLLERIAELVNDKKLNGISDLRDESDREGVRIVIELKKDAVGAVVLNNLYMKTGLQSTFSGNFLALSKVMNLCILFYIVTYCATNTNMHMC